MPVSYMCAVHNCQCHVGTVPFKLRLLWMHMIRRSTQFLGVGISMLFLSKLIFFWESWSYFASLPHWSPMLFQQECFSLNPPAESSSRGRRLEMTAWGKEVRERSRQSELNPSWMNSQLFGIMHTYVYVDVLYLISSFQNILKW